MIIDERTTYPESGDINTCCGRKTAVTSSRIEVSTMRVPPATYDRWLHIYYWQCMVVESHKGQVWETKNDGPPVVRHNVFEEDDEDT